MHRHIDRPHPLRIAIVCGAVLAALASLVSLPGRARADAFPSAGVFANAPVAQCTTHADPTLLNSPCEPYSPVPVQTRIAGWPGPSYQRQVGMRIGNHLILTQEPTPECPAEALLVGIDRLTLTTAGPSSGLTVPLCSQAAGSDLQSAVRSIVDADRRLAAHDPAVHPMIVLDTFTRRDGTVWPRGITLPGVSDVLGKLGVSSGSTATVVVGVDVSVIGVAGEQSSGNGLDQVIPAGAAWVSAPWAGSYPVDGASRATSDLALAGNMPGYLSHGGDSTPDGNSYWGFDDPANIDFDLHVNQAWNKNTIRVGRHDFTQKWGVAAPVGNGTPAGTTGVAGFQLLVLNARSLVTVDSEFFVTRQANTTTGVTWTDQAGLTALRTSLAGYRGQDVLIFLASANTPLAEAPASRLCTTSPRPCGTKSYAGQAGTVYDAELGLADTLRSLGADPETFLGLAGMNDATPTGAKNYSFIGSGITTAARAAQGITDVGIQRVLSPQPAERGGALTPWDSSAELNGTLSHTPDRQHWHVNVAAGSVNTTMIDAVPVPAVDQGSAMNRWPLPQGNGCVLPESTSGCNQDQLKAFEWFGEQLTGCTAYGCGLTIRDFYRSRNALPWADRLMCSQPDGTGCLLELDHGCPTSGVGIPYPGPAYFSCAAYTAIRKELSAETWQQNNLANLIGRTEDNLTAMSNAWTTAMFTAWTNVQGALSGSSVQVTMNGDLGEAMGTAAILGTEAAGFTAGEAWRGRTLGTGALGIGLTAAFTAAIWFGAWEGVGAVESIETDLDGSAFAAVNTFNGAVAALQQVFKPDVAVNSKLDLVLEDGTTFASLGATALIDDPVQDALAAHTFEPMAELALYEAILPSQFEVMDVSNAPSPNVFDWGVFIGCTRPDSATPYHCVPGLPPVGVVSSPSEHAQMPYYGVYDHTFWDYWQPKNGRSAPLAAESTIDTHSWSGGATPNTVFTGNTINADPRNLNSYPAEDIAIGRINMVAGHVGDLYSPVRYTSTPLPDAILTRIASIGGYLPDVYRQWPFRRHSCDAGNSVYSDNWAFPVDCYWGDEEDKYFNENFSGIAAYHSAVDKADPAPPEGLSYPYAGAVPQR